MSDRETFLLQLLVPAVTAVAIFLLRPRLAGRPVEGGCLSSMIATALIAALMFATAGATSTFSIGLLYTAGTTFIVSVALLALLRALRAF